MADRLNWCNFVRKDHVYPLGLVLHLHRFSSKILFVDWICHNLRIKIFLLRRRFETCRTISFFTILLNVNLLRWNDVPRGTSRTFCPKLQRFLSFKYIETKRMIGLLFLANFEPVILYRRIRKKKKATNYRVRFGHSLRYANQLPAQEIGS